VQLLKRDTRFDDGVSQFLVDVDDLGHVPTQVEYDLTVADGCARPQTILLPALIGYSGTRWRLATATTAATSAVSFGNTTPRTSRVPRVVVFSP